MKSSCPPGLPGLPGLIVAALLLVTRAAGAEVLFSIEDPKGDDIGSGDLLYPNRDDLEPGDLDIVRFSAEKRDDGVWFVLEMAQPIRSPVGRVTEVGQTAIDRIARNGFYTFNVDIYIDTDRIAGLGEIDSVPGRGVTVDRNFAWERAIVLTPRPDTARTLLQLYYDKEYEAEIKAKSGRTSKEDMAAVESRSEKRVSDLYFFPTKVRVAGRRIEFQVPTEFLGDVPSKSWGYTVIVTGADIEQTGRPGPLGPTKSTMMTLPVARGLRSSHWGIRGNADEATPPIVDLLATDPSVQATVLNDYDMVAGRLAAMPGVAPDGKVAVAMSGAQLTVEQAARLDSAGTGTGIGTASESGAAAPEKRAVPARLRTLSQLLEEGLITESEYTELRRKILAEL